MAQTDKAKQNQAGQNQGDSGNQSPPLTQEALQKLLGPVMETVTQLKAEQEKEAASKLAAVEAAKQAQLNKDADLAAMLDNVDMSEGTEDKYDKLSNRQIIDVIAGAVETAMEANTAKIKNDISQSLKPNADKMVVMERAVMTILGTLGMQETRSKHADFDEHKDEIAKVMGENPALSFEDGYYLAKSRKAGSLPPSGQINTEKPTDSVWPQENAGAVVPNQAALQEMADRGRESRDDTAVTKSGTVGIRNIIAVGMEKVGVGSKRQ